MGRSSSTTCNAAQVNMHQLGIDDPTHLGVEYDRPLKLKRNDRWAWITKPCVHFVYRPPVQPTPRIQYGMYIHMEHSNQNLNGDIGQGGSVQCKRVDADTVWLSACMLR